MINCPLKCVQVSLRVNWAQKLISWYLPPKLRQRPEQLIQLDSNLGHLHLSSDSQSTKCILYTTAPFAQLSGTNLSLLPTTSSVVKTGQNWIFTIHTQDLHHHTYFSKNQRFVNPLSGEDSNVSTAILRGTHLASPALGQFLVPSYVLGRASNKEVFQAGSVPLFLLAMGLKHNLILSVNPCSESN